MKATKAKEYITLRFSEGPDAYSVRSVPILDKVSICGVEGFAVHRKFYNHRSEPVPRQFRISHIETGAAISDGPSIAKALQEATTQAVDKGGKKAILAAINRLKRKYKKLKLIV